MEKKTIGGFIAALRKANGMTQKELAERLNVSDKTVSRWERDDGAPDLSVIPVIAEIFGVTCDELLRGERRSAGERAEAEEENTTTPKGEKQRQHLLRISLSKYKTKSFIAMGISVVGLIAAMICNFGFLRAYIGFFVGTIFYLASFISQAIFVNQAFLSVSDETLSSTETASFKRSVIKMAEWSAGLTFILFGITLPLIIWPNDTYVGLTGETWIFGGFSYGIVTFLFLSLLYYFLNAWLIQKEILILPEKESHTYWENHRLKRKCAMLLVLLAGITGLCHLFVRVKWDATALSDGIVFSDYESFIEFMEQDIPYENYSNGFSSGSEYAEEPLLDPDFDVFYYDQNGNEISEEEALRREIYDSDGNVIVEYLDRNESVVIIRYREKDGDILPITVITQEQYRRGAAKENIIHLAFCMVYGIETIAVLGLYWRKRTKTR